MLSEMNSSCLCVRSGCVQLNYGIKYIPSCASPVMHQPHAYKNILNLDSSYLRGRLRTCRARLGVKKTELDQP